jgi:hypothetical protein
MDQVQEPQFRRGGRMAEGTATGVTALSIPRVRMRCAAGGTADGRCLASGS